MKPLPASATDEELNSSVERRVLLPLLFLGLALTCCILCVSFPGTSDVPDYWLRWSGLMQEHGMAKGYTIAYSDYPPGAFAFLFLTSQVALWLHLENFILLKIAITLCALMATLLFGLWNRNLGQTAGFLFAITLNSAALGYLDAVCLPALLFALWALQRQCLALASGCFMLAVSMKWQPLIIAPFFLVQALGLRPASWRQPQLWLRPLGRLAAGAAPVAIGAMLLFDPVTIYRAFDKALHFHTALSYQGLNLNWIWQLLVHQHQGNPGLQLFDTVPPVKLALAMKLLFAATYAFLLLTQFYRSRGFADFVWFALIGYFSYCSLALGVHENHLFLTMILAFALFCARGTHALPLAFFFSLSTNLNLLLFYGINGRWQCDSIGATVALSLLNTVFFVSFLWQAGQRLRTKPDPAARR